MEQNNELTRWQLIEFKRKLKPKCRTLMFDGKFYHFPVKLQVEKLWDSPVWVRRRRGSPLNRNETTTLWSTVCEYQGPMTEVIVGENEDLENWCPACALITLSGAYD